MPELKPYKGDYYLWDYVPSLAASVVFTIAFFIATVAVSWRMLRTRTWFCIPFVLGGVEEVLGYISRGIAYNATDSLAIYILQATFLLLPPVFFAATLYMVYSRIVRAVQGDRFSLITPRWTTRVFVIGDFLTLNVQSTGASLLANEKHTTLGNNIVITGLILQILLFACFIACCTVFHKRFKAHVRLTGFTTNLPWKEAFHMLYWTSGAVLIRNTFRVVEYIQGRDGYLMKKEWPIWVFDGVLMFLVMVVFFIWYPHHFQPNRTESMIELTSERGQSSELVGSPKRRQPWR